MKVLLKDFETKYPRIELKIDKSDRLIFKPGIHNLEDLKKQYGYYYVVSYKYFDDTRTTSVVISKKPDDCEEDTTPHLTNEERITLILKLKSMGRLK